MLCWSHRSGATARVVLFPIIMIPHSAWKIARGAAAAILTLLGSALLAPSTAHASCGDYVMIGSHHSAHHSGPAASGYTDSTGQADDQTPVPRCHGPHCSNKSLPPAAPAPRIEMTVEQWAVWGDASLAILPDCESLLAEARAVTCDGFGLSVLRPPR
jgi:hypothetical protein